MMSSKTEINEDFHPYVRLLLARMKSNPQEFNPELVPYSSGPDTWYTAEEKQAVWEAEREIMLTSYHQRLMQRILDGDAPQKKQAALDTIIRTAQHQALLAMHQSQYANQSGINPSPPAAPSVSPYTDMTHTRSR